MNFAEASKYLDNLPSFTAKGVRDGKISYNLLAIRELLKRLGNPSHGMKIVHIAGTNGKVPQQYISLIFLKREDIG